MAFHNLVRPAAAGLCVLLAGMAAADEKKSAGLTPKEVADGWVQLFDGGSTFGWTVEGHATVKDGVLVVGGEKATKLVSVAEFYAPEVYFAATTADGKAAGGGDLLLPQFADSMVPLAGVKSIAGTTRGSGSRKRGAGPIRLELPAGTVLHATKLAVKPSGLEPLFDGKTLAGWKKYTGDPKREKTAFAVTAAGELSAKNGPGDLQTEQQFADFVLQLECKTNGLGLNSGVFFRGLPGQYQQGYEAQIQNAIVGGDRTKPLDFGTGAIYRRIAARKVVSNDNEWFTMTVLAKGSQINTWVNGYPVVSWTDDRKPAENGRNGLKTSKGVISIQGHDPTTDLLFRNIRVAEIK